MNIYDDFVFRNQFLLNSGHEVVLPITVDEGFKAHWKPDGFSNEDHHNMHEAVSSTGLSMIHQYSPYALLEYLKARQNGKRTKQTKSMRFGEICHLMFLEPEVFKKKVIIAPKFDLRTKDGQLDWDIFKLQNDGAIIFPHDKDKDFERLVGVVTALINHPKAKNIFEKGWSEKTGVFRHPGTGILSRFRADHFSDIIPGYLMSDFKTSKSVTYEDFRRSINKYGYHVQMALYRLGFKEIMGDYPKVWNWTVVENQFPYEVAIWPASEAMISYGELWYEHYMQLLKRCIDNRIFPQRNSKISAMSPTDFDLEKTPNMESYLWER